ncbi:MAG: helix-turn-helix domain-containing protein [Candidatus Marinimicrobia bacterium]|nr:helix-turn-helix domain-containing protein [Candidatus Neomarinimicrobiota bacterium]
MTEAEIDKTTTLPVLLTAKEVAKWLRISRERLYSLCYTQEFPFIKISKGRIRFAVNDIQSWLREKGWQG